MRPLRLAALASTVFAFAFAPSTSSAQSTTTRTWDVVTEYTVDTGSTPPRLEFVGVVSGATVSSSMILTFSSNYVDLGTACQRELIQMVNRPGRFQFVVDAGTIIPVNATSIQVQKCTLRQKP
jgi:hypothetical protein